MRKFFSRRISKHTDIAPDEIFLDDRNIPDFDTQQFEGRIEQPIKRRTIYILALVFVTIGMVFLSRAAVLQVHAGAEYTQMSINNHLDHETYFAERGIIYDRNGVELAWNVPAKEDLGFSLRKYIDTPGFGHILGFVQYPARDKRGFYYRTEYSAITGVEAEYDTQLKGKNGLRIIETDALGRTVSGSVIDPPVHGENITLGLDVRVQKAFYDQIRAIVLEHDFQGGAGAIMDINNGELLSIVSFPDYDPNIMTDGQDHETIDRYMKDERAPFLDRAVSGLYTPGSIVKPIYAIGALKEGIITPNKEILSTGSISIPNPYFPEKESVFNDWRAHGYVDMRTAIAQSSDVYFYEIGGGYKSQKGLGVQKLEKYARMFGFGTTTGIDLQNEAVGTIPNPEWKAEHFDGDPWRVGDTYFTAIGQYGAQVTLLQALKSASIIASRGHVPVPTLRRGGATSTDLLDIPTAYFEIAQEGMRQAVTTGTAHVADIPYVKMAAKTGTAELGVTKVRVNSWIIGFFPYNEPRYAFAIVMERGPKGNTYNATYVAQQFFSWMGLNTPEYFDDSHSGLRL